MPIAAGIYYSLHAAGREATVVLIHGAGGSHLSWPPQVRRLPAHTTLALDLPGHGRSGLPGLTSISAYADRVLEWMRAVGSQSAVMVGHSMGGAIAQMLAIEHPAQVAGLLLIGCGAHMKVNPLLLQECADETTVSGAIEKIIAWSFSPAYPERFKTLVAHRMQMTSHQVLLGDLIACDQFDSSASLLSIQCPTLVISGGNDKMVPVRMAVDLAERIPGARLEILPDAAHMVMIEQPEQVAVILSSFLAGLSS